MYTGRRLRYPGEASELYCDTGYIRAVGLQSFSYEGSLLWACHDCPSIGYEDGGRVGLHYQSMRKIEPRIYVFI
jgi:hypothetical protein